MAFDIRDVLGTVSKSDPGQEQIVYIALDKLDGDPNNFYTLEGIEELADNISLIGLQQPLRIRPGKDGHFVIVSGHRRRAACLLISHGDTENAHMFDQGVPCIIDNDECSPAMRELRLIYANSATRVMTPAEVSKQAERIESILYQLAEEGVEFKGRMRDHVAKACAVSKTKIARLHAIRNNLIPDLLKWFDNNQLNESEAYELQKLPKTAQEEIAASIKRTGDAYFINLDGCLHCSKMADKFMKACSCPKGGECDHHEKRFVQSLRAGMSWERCTGGCCLKCDRYSGTCAHDCTQMKVKQKAAAALKKVEKQEEDNRRARIAEEQQKAFRMSRQNQGKRVMPLIEKKGLGPEYQLPGSHSWSHTAVRSYAKAAAGDFGDAHFYDDELIPHSSDGLMEMAELLDCSVDYLLGLTTDPTPASLRDPASESDTAAAAPAEWQTGTPTREGRYLCTVDLGASLAEQRCDWNGSEWRAYGRPIADMFKVVAWYPLPERTYRPEDDWEDPEEEEDADDDL